jgi:hypothetical protein
MASSVISRSPPLQFFPFHFEIIFFLFEEVQYAKMQVPREMADTPSSARVARFFLVQKYQKGENKYQITTKDLYKMEV